MNGYMLTYMWKNEDDESMHSSAFLHRHNAVKELYSYLEVLVCDAVQHCIEMQRPDPHDIYRLVDLDKGRYSDFDKDEGTLITLIDVMWGGDFCYTIKEIVYNDL